MKTEDKVLIGAGAVASGMALAYALSPVKAVGRNVVIYLTLNVSDGGTTFPAKGTYQYNSTGKVILKATPLVGYYFNGWYVQGKLLSKDLTFSYNLTEDVVISASFVKEDQPILIPSYITPFEKVKVVLAHNWSLYRTAVIDPLGIMEYQVIHFERKSQEWDTLRFKLCDKNGNGVPQQSIALYTDNMPDASQFGSLYIAKVVTVGPPYFVKHTIGNPLILTTDVNGIVEVICAYRWEEPITGIESSHDYISTLGRSGKLKWVAPGFASGWYSPIWDQEHSPKYWYFPPFPMPPIPIPISSGWDEWQLLLDPVYRTVNAVHAYWVDNPNLLNMGVGSADCNIRMMQSTTNIPSS